MTAVLEPVFVWIHVAAAITALVMAPVAMAVRKGGAHHRRWGKVYFWAMFGIFVSALGLLAYRPNVFLLFISILSFYAALTGYRALYRKSPKRGQRATALDWTASTIALLSSACFIGWGAFQLLGIMSMRYNASFAILGLVFGSVLGRDAYVDVRSYLQPSDNKNWWWFYHMDRMVGSYIAAITAFMVQNVGPRLPMEYSWVVWIAPAIIGTPALIYWTNYYKRLFAKRGTKAARPRPAVEPTQQPVQL